LIVIPCIMLPISLCMIVKNEENNLGKCLNKVINFVDEIVIVDTGSTDKTKEIACKYTDKVYDFDWVDDFSKARNFSVSKAANDWILVLDADEFLVSFDKHQVQNFMLKYEKSIGRIERIEIISQKQQSQEDKKAVERISRLFNKNYYCYEGLVHEQITPKEGIISTSGIVNITVNHTGYIKNVVNEKKKWERNKRLLKKSIQKNPNDPYLYYHMGKINYLKEGFHNE
jgi:glycosyltransferase involved in cell wall biosynthesis